MTNNSLNNEKLCINIKEAAKLCGCCENTMRQMVHMRRFPKIKVGRRIIIPKQAFVDWLNSGFKEVNSNEKHAYRFRT